MKNRRDALRTGLGLVASFTVIPAIAESSTSKSNSQIGQAPSNSSFKTIRTRFSKGFELKHPLICAGMSFVCDTPKLAIAVCQAGGIGCLAGSLLSPQTLRARIQEIKGATDTPFHVNFLAPFPHQEQIRICIEEQVPIISFHWGLPSAPIMSQLKTADISVWAQIGTVSAARKAHKAGVDAIIVQGAEAGGHNYGGMPLSALFPAVKEVLPEDMLVFAAGGISDGHTVAAALSAGADGVWIGTRLVATTEANAHKEYKKRLVKASGEDTILTSVFGPENPKFNPVRVIKNEIVSQWHDRTTEIPKDRSALPPIGSTIFAEREIDVREFDSFVPVPKTTGDFDKMPMLAGQGVGLVKSIVSTRTVIDQIMNDASVVIQAIDAS